jgi:NADH-quinone oxidoreductase subunit E/NADP-reducing hydrogenase subunit HndA
MKGNVLVVDDEQVVLRSCERVLGAEGYYVHTADSARKALELIRENAYDLMLTDIRMPEMDGIELARQVKEKNPDLDIIIMTGHPSQENIKDALSLRIVDYITKPISPAVLVEAAQKAIDISKKHAATDFEEEDYTEEAARKLDEIIARHRDRPGSLIPVLQEAQGVVGYLPPVVQRHIAKGLNMSVSEVHGVVSFYSFFTMKPRGKHNIRVCLGTACYVKRAEEIVQKLREQLGIDLGEVTSDRSFSLESVRCLGACGLAPVVVVDEDTHGSVNPVKTGEIIDQYRH